jgi:HK97 family phage portal protein
MGKITEFLKQIGRPLTVPRVSGYGGRAGWGLQRIGRPGDFDYQREAGPLYQSSIPFMCLAWEKRNTIEAELVVQRRDKNGDWVNQRAHFLYKLLDKPNEFWDLHDLLDCVRFDYHLTGNAYLWKRRSGSGAVVELHWLPSWCTSPRWHENGLALIGCYEYMVDGVSWAIPVEDVIHFKGILPDPRTNGRTGLSTFSAVLREVCTDNEAAVFTASLLRNMGIPGVVVSPKGTEGNPGYLNDDQRLEFKRLWNDSFTGERRGEPFVQSIPVDITMPGFSPQQMAIDAIRKIPETRISGAFGIPLSVLQLATGLENSNTNANKSDDRKQAIEACVVPTLLGLARVLTRGLVREVENPRDVRLWFDLSNMQCMKENENEVTKTLVAACGGPFMTPNEARSQRGLAVLPGANELRSGKAVSPGQDEQGEKPDAAGGGDPDAKDGKTAPIDADRLE